MGPTCRCAYTCVVYVLGKK
uniref:Uncharacterized protein n=1 Tax=Anguilla anguilla TaxID=7936 RepID=A0A0E9QIJ3_ANGAN